MMVIHLLTETLFFHVTIIIFYYNSQWLQVVDTDTVSLKRCNRTIDKKKKKSMLVVLKISFVFFLFSFSIVDEMVKVVCLKSTVNTGHLCCDLMLVKKISFLAEGQRWGRVDREKKDWIQGVGEGFAALSIVCVYIYI